MKNFICMLLALGFSLFVYAQEEDISTISKDACECLTDIQINSERAQRYEEIRSCISASIIGFQMKDQLMGATRKALDSLNSTEEEIQSDTISMAGKNVIVSDLYYEEIEETLLRECSAMKALMTNDEPTDEISISDKKRAQAAYVEGQLYFRNGDFKEAIKHFKKAVKRDKTFAFAWDMLGYSHRKNGDFEKAIECYEKSIILDPKGRMPLLNTPIAYEYMKEYDKALEGFQRFVKTFEDDPEGYYGSGRMYMVMKNYEPALDNIMKAFVMYNQENSPYARDAEARLGELYQILNENNNLELFFKLAEKHDIQVEK